MGSEGPKSQSQAFLRVFKRYVNLVSRATFQISIPLQGRKGFSIELLYRSRKLTTCSFEN